MADKLAEIDLSTPLREDELLPKFEHRRVNDPALMAGAGKGRCVCVRCAVVYFFYVYFSCVLLLEFM